MSKWINKVFIAAAFYYLILGAAGLWWHAAWYAISGLNPVGAEFILDTFGGLMFTLAAASFLGLIIPSGRVTILIILCFANLFDLAIILASVPAGTLGIAPASLFIAADLIWLTVLGFALTDTYKRSRKALLGDAESLDSALQLRAEGSALSLAELSDSQPLLLVLLRHSGCTFCRMHLAELSLHQEQWRSRGARLVIVGLSSIDDLRDLVKNYELGEPLLVSDPNRKLYRALGTVRGSLFQLFGLHEIWKAIFTGGIWKHGIGAVSADPSQLGGTFVVDKRKVVFSQPAKTASEICPLSLALPRSA